MAEGELAAITYASDIDDRSSESNLPTNLPLVPVNPSPATGLELGDDREPIGPPCEGSTRGSITPVLASPTEEERHDGTDVQVASNTIFPTNIGVRVLLKEIKCLTHRAEFLETVVEPLKRQDEAAADESSKPNSESSKQPAQGQGGVDLALELKQSIKESAELIRVINGDFSRLGEKLNEWVPVVYKKGELTKDIFTTLVTEQKERVKELKEQLDNVQQQLSRKNMEMELAYEEQKTKIRELSEELSRKKELEGLRKHIEQLDLKVKEHEKKEVLLYHEIKGKNSEMDRLSALLQEKREKIAQIKRDLNNKMESTQSEMVQGLEKERDKLFTDNQQQKEKISELERNLEATRVELIKQLKTDKEQLNLDKKHQMEQSSLMLNVIHKKILDTGVQEQLIQRVLKINDSELASGPSRNETVEGAANLTQTADLEHVLSDKSILDDMSHKNH